MSGKGNGKGQSVKLPRRMVDDMERMLRKGSPLLAEYAHGVEERKSEQRSAREAEEDIVGNALGDSKPVYSKDVFNQHKKNQNY